MKTICFRNPCKCIEQMGNDFWFLPVGVCLFKKEEKKMTHPIPTANVIDVLDAILDDMIAEEAETEKGDIRVAYLQRAIEILKEVVNMENVLRDD